MRSLPPGFEARYVASRTLTFLPPFGTVGAFSLWHQATFALPIIVVMLLGLVLVAAMARRWARLERPALESFANEETPWPRGLSVDKIQGEILPAALGGLLSGGILAALMRDARWLILGAALSSLLLIGLALRWAVYDRWLDCILASQTS